MPIHALPADCPSTDAQLFDALHRLHGLGRPREGEPWWQTRAREVAKVRASRASRRVSVADLYVAGIYTKTYGLRVNGITWLYRHISPAWRWWDAGAGRPVTRDLDAAYSAAIQTEMRTPDSHWLDRLLRANDREAVYQEWLDDQH